MKEIHIVSFNIRGLWQQKEEQNLLLKIFQWHLLHFKKA